MKGEDTRIILNGHEGSVVMNALAGFMTLYRVRRQVLVNMMAKCGLH
jgi:hypothetical protein